MLTEKSFSCGKILLFEYAAKSRNWSSLAELSKNRTFADYFKFVTIRLTRYLAIRLSIHVCLYLVREMQINPELSMPFIQACSAIDRVKTQDLKSKRLVYLHRPKGSTFIVKRGYVRLASADPSGRLTTRMLLGRGAIFGELPFQPESSTSIEQAITSGMSCIMEIPRNRLEAYCEQDTRFQTLMLQTIASQYSALERRLQWQFVNPIRRRVAAALYDLICFAGGRCGHGHLIDVRLTHEEFAELIVAARPVVSDVLAGLKSHGIIDYTRGHICILSIDGLQEIVSNEG